MSFFVEDSIWIFLIMTVIFGGGAAFMAGRALASGWRSPWILAFYMLLLTAGLRFLHFALFEAELTSLQHYISDGIIIMAAAFLGYRYTRAEQMTQKYPWLYERSGPLGWRQKN